jgi:thiol-disulfide isomerase/thioredoxin
VVLSVQNLACVDCGGELVDRARQQAGVRVASFDEKKLELTLDLAPGTSLEAIVRAVEKEPIDERPITLVVGAGRGKFAPFQPLDPAWDAKLVSAHGEDVASLEPAQGKVTVADFFADWCGPCHDLDDLMHGVLKDAPSGVAYRRLNVVDWDSPVAAHWLKGVPGLPFVIVFDREGKELARLSGFKPAELKAAIEKGLHP